MLWTGNLQGCTAQSVLERAIKAAQLCKALEQLILFQTQQPNKAWQASVGGNMAAALLLSLHLIKLSQH